MKNEECPKTILLWSGGMDSTALLLRNLRTPNLHVVGCGLVAANNYEEDKKARETIANILELNKHENITYHVIDNLPAVGISGIQSNTWAAVAPMFVDPRTDSEVTFMFGFIRYDDFWHYREYFEATVRNMVRIHSSERNIKLNFSYPLEWNDKKEILMNYINFSNVFHAISWGGDTKTAKAKEKEDLEKIFELMMYTGKNSGPIPDKQIESQSTETEKPSEILNSSESLSRQVDKDQSNSGSLST